MGNRIKKPADISQEDRESVDVPEVTDAEFATARPFKEVFPEQYKIWLPHAASASPERTMQRFENDDAGYRQWLRDHLAGHVPNTSSHGNHARIHRSSCNELNRLSHNARMANPFTRSYHKVCADSESELFSWVQANRPDPEIKHCPKC